MVTGQGGQARYPRIVVAVQLLDGDGDLAWHVVWEDTQRDEDAVPEAKGRAREALEAHDALQSGVVADVYHPAYLDRLQVPRPAWVEERVLLAGPYAKRVLPPDVRARLRPQAPVGIEMVAPGTSGAGAVGAAPWALDGDTRALGEGGRPTRGVPGQKAGKKGQSSIAKGGRSGKQGKGTR